MELRSLTVIVAACTLAACGGGGAGDSAAPATAVIAAPAKPAERMTVIERGDSTTVGAGGPEAPAEVAQKLLLQWLGQSSPLVLQEGYSGTSIAQMLQGTDGSGVPFAQWLETRKPSMVLINHAHNSTRQPLETFKGQVLEAVRTAQAKGVPVMLLTPNPVLADAGWEVQATEDFAQAIREVASDTGAKLCDVNLKMHQAGMVDAFNYHDPIHLNSYGYTFTGEVRARCLLKALSPQEGP